MPTNIDKIGIRVPQSGDVVKCLVRDVGIMRLRIITVVRYDPEQSAWIVTVKNPGCDTNGYALDPSHVRKVGPPPDRFPLSIVDDLGTWKPTSAQPELYP